MSFCTYLAKKNIYYKIEYYKMLLLNINKIYVKSYSDKFGATLEPNSEFAFAFVDWIGS